MPYKDTSELPEQVKSLPEGAKRIWMRTFNNAYSRLKNELAAIKIAWSAVKKKYHKVNDKWVLKK